MNPTLFICLPLLLICQLALSQSKLRITWSRFGFIKKHEVFEGDVIRYKLKGDRHYHTSKVMVLHDSTIIFESEDEITLNQLKKIRTKTDNYYNKLFQRFFLDGAVMYPFVAVTNNAINGDTPLLTQRAVIVSLSFLAGKLIVRQLGIKHIRMNKHKALKIISINYQQLGK